MLPAYALARKVSSRLPRSSPSAHMHAGWMRRAEAIRGATRRICAITSISVVKRVGARVTTA
eukprot:454005-Prymnesium_polylepis.1